DLAIGDPIVRAAAEAGLDTVGMESLFWLGLMLAETGYWDRSELVFHRLRDRGEPEWHATFPLFFTSLAQGRTRDAHRWLRDPFAPQSRKARMLHALVEAGAPADDDELDAVLGLHAHDGADAVQLFHIGGLAASHGRWPIFDASLDRLNTFGRSLRAAGDSAEADFTEAVRLG